jgi:hypothetical protein
MEIRKEIAGVLKYFSEEALTTDEAIDSILLLFGVMESDCDHEWLNHSFDHFGFAQEQICDKCGAKQSVF